MEVYEMVIQMAIVLGLGLKALYLFSKTEPFYLFAGEEDLREPISNARSYNNWHGVMVLVAGIPFIVFAILSVAFNRSWIMETVFAGGILYPIYFMIVHAVLKHIYVIRHEEEQPFRD